MYCRNCGKFIGTDDELCEECLHNDLVFGQEQKAASQPTNPTPVANAAPVANPAPSTSSAPQQNVQAQQDTRSIRMTGFKPALTSTIVGVIAFIMVIVAFSLATSYAAMRTVNNLGGFYYDGNDYTYVHDTAASAGVLGASIVVFIIGLAMTVLAMVFGIKTLVRSVRTKRQYDIMPVPALVLSIVGTVASAISCIWLFITFIIMTTF